MQHTTNPYQRAQFGCFGFEPFLISAIALLENPSSMAVAPYAEQLARTYGYFMKILAQTASFSPALLQQKPTRCLCLTSIWGSQIRRTPLHGNTEYIAHATSLTMEPIHTTKDPAAPALNGSRPLPHTGMPPEALKRNVISYVQNSQHGYRHIRSAQHAATKAAMQTELQERVRVLIAHFQGEEARLEQTFYNEISGSWAAQERHVAEVQADFARDLTAALTKWYYPAPVAATGESSGAPLQTNAGDETQRGTMKEG